MVTKKGKLLTQQERHKKMRIKRLNPGFENVKGESNTLNDGVTSEGMGEFGGEPKWALGGNSVLPWDKTG